MGKKESRIKKRYIALIIVLCLLVAGTVFVLQQLKKPSNRLLLATLHFAQETIPNHNYFLYDVDIMELCTDYFNGETVVSGRLGLSEMKKVRSSTYVDVQGVRSFSQKAMSVKSDVSLLWFEMGQLNTYIDDDTVYFEMPLLGDEGYAFPTDLDMFTKAPDFTSDISQEWFSEHATDIVNFMGKVTIDDVGKTLVDEDGTISDKYVITIPQGCGDFIWELLGVESPEYDVVVSEYVTRDNHVRRIEFDLEHAMPGANMALDGLDMGTMYFYYELPENESMSMTMVRNPVGNQIDFNTEYNANNGSKLTTEGYMTWENTEVGFDFKIKDMYVKKDDDKLAKVYFVGSVDKSDRLADVLEGKQEIFEDYEVLDWRALRDDVDGTTAAIMSKINIKTFLEN
ncbi:MAG: hypothetical protein HUJ71_09540 [Pseudobutyrivibrio sp.]|nr:hypothetical protein [Pseudobutyrivibrio sp.]